MSLPVVLSSSRVLFAEFVRYSTTLVPAGANHEARTVSAALFEVAVPNSDVRVPPPAATGSLTLLRSPEFLETKFNSMYFHTTFAAA